MRRNIVVGLQFSAIGALGMAMSIVGCECEGAGPPLTRLAADIEAMPTVLDFGEISLGTVKQLPVSVRNTGDDRLRICLQLSEPTETNGCTELSSIEPQDAPFSTVFEQLSDQGNWFVDRGQERQFLIQFAPLAEGSYQGKFIIQHNGLSGPTTEITFTGSGVKPVVNFDTTALDFGDVTVNKRKTLSFTLTNGTQFPQPIVIPPVQQTAVIFGTENNGEITLEGETLQATLEGNSTLTINVWYSPPEEGSHMKDLPVLWCPDQAQCTTVVSLTGRGVKPTFAIMPASIDFGQKNIGETAAESFQIRNVGNSAFVVSAIDFENRSAPEFAVAPQMNLPVTLQPDATLDVAVTYTTMGPGMDTDRIVVTTDAYDDPSTPSINESVGYVDVTGLTTGPNINPLPPALNFGTIAINGTPATRSVLLENSGNSDLTISAITLQTMSPEYTLGMLPSLPAVVRPGDTVEVRVTYGPTDGGLDQAVILVVSDDHDQGNLPIPIQGTGGVPTTCAITVAPSQLTFGLVERGTQVTLPVEIRNAGAQPCTISNIALMGNPEFTLAGSVMGSVPIAPGSRHRIQIQYAPTAYGTHNTQLQFNTDDPANPMQAVQISGSSAPSDIRVIPSQLDFAVVPVTCRSPNRAITVYNTGSNAVTIQSVALDPSTTSEFELQPFSTPANLAAGGSAVINMRYHPRDIGADSGVLFITIDLGSNIQRVAVPLTGEGQLNPTVTDTFQQLPTPQADVLFVVDNSCSMSEEQSSLGRNLGQFLSFATQQGIDYQIAVTTTDVNNANESGRFVQRQAPRIIRPNTPNATSVFQANVTLGTRGSGNEQGLEAAYLALSDPLINTANAGFLRQSAALAVIAVSDEDDHSRRTVSFYENFLRNIKGFTNSSQFSFSAIVGTQQPSCSGSGGRASYGARYIQVAQTTGGVVESICNANWGQTLANIGLNSFGLKRQFILSSQPVPSTVRVEVNGTLVPSVNGGGTQQWTYAQATNSVDFQSGSVPPPNATVSITYTVACLP